MESATKVEFRNFDIRKSLKFDDVLNDQRKVIFSQRKEVLGTQNILNLQINPRDEIDDLLKNVKNYNFQTIKLQRINFNHYYQTMIVNILIKFC